MLICDKVLTELAEQKFLEKNIMKVIKKEKMSIISNKGICDGYVKKNKIIGILAGIISGLFGAGGGLILVPAFVNMLNTDEKKGKSHLCILHNANGNSNSIFFITKIIIYSGT